MQPDPENFLYADVHRHHRPGPERGFFLRNAFHFREPASLSALAYPVSAGLHPMHADSFNEQVENRLNLHWQQANVLAIGECGLDSRFPHPERQSEIFSWHVARANQIRKPLVLHLVRCDDRARRILRDAQVPFVLHGFRGKPQRLRSWLEYPNAWFSFGWALSSDPHTQDSFRCCPADRILLETDADPRGIRGLYTLAMSLRPTESAPLPGLVFENAKRFFGLNCLPIFDPS